MEAELQRRANHHETREVEVLCSQGKTVAEAVRQICVSEQTYSRWRRQYGGMSSSEAQRMKEVEKENALLKELVAEQALDIALSLPAITGATDIDALRPC